MMNYFVDKIKQFQKNKNRAKCSYDALFTNSEEVTEENLRLILNDSGKDVSYERALNKN
ncbi:hypothetical protein RAL98_02730 [Staphylococcus sp. HKU1]|uniref:hypothetical protein n=1 Tax=Staphylococcus sp. HKU1 TaxID=3068989 RepID=UPI003AABEF40